MDGFVFPVSCPVCGASLYPSDYLFLNEGQIIGCEKCYDKNKNAIANEMMVVEDYLNPYQRFFPIVIN